MLGATGPGAGGYGYVAGQANVAAAGTKVYGGTIPQAVYVSPNPLAPTPVTNTLQSIDDYLGAGPRALTGAIDTTGQAVASAGSTVFTIGEWLLIGLGLVAAIVIIPRILPKQ